MTTPPTHADPTAGTRGRTTGRTWSPGSPDGTAASARRTVASFATYEEAERAVDRLADPNFPVQPVATVGQVADQAARLLATGV